MRQPGERLALPLQAGPLRWHVPSYLISKGIFERAINCSNHNLKDSELTTFASVNAASIARLPHFGFLWDSPNANKPVIFATQVSVLDGLNAAMTGSSAMC